MNTKRSTKKQKQKLKLWEKVAFYLITHTEKKTKLTNAWTQAQVQEQMRSHTQIIGTWHIIGPVTL